MDKIIRSWSKPDGIEGLIGRKRVDVSIFKYGTHIPLGFIEDFEKANGGIHLDRGENRQVQLVFEDQLYLVNLNNIDRTKTSSDTLQLRWEGNKEFINLLKKQFNISFSYFNSSGKIEGQEEIDIEDENSYTPQDSEEYIEFYETGTPFKYRIKFIRDSKVSDVNVWWVNQGFSQKNEYAYGMIFAPLAAKDGKKIYHWDNMKEVKEGDIIIHYADNAIRFVGRVIEPPIECAHPDPKQNIKEPLMGRLIKVEYHELNPIIKIKAIARKLLDLDIKQGPVDKSGRVKQGYLFRFTQQGLAVIQSIQPETIWPEFSRYALKKPINYNPLYSLQECAKDTGISEIVLAQWIKAIDRKGQAILYGPPGTGKTFVATKLSRHLVSQGDGFVELIQFHPAYAYEDFIQGIRPQVSDSGTLSYSLVPGRFLEFCKKAEQCTGNCILIIDEINRANLSRVFGELMYVLEYRNQEIPLAGGGKISIPENVRILGTMNTADRSIAFVDHALRRRFAFLALQSNYAVLQRYHEDTNMNVMGLIKVLKQINIEIDDRNYEIGISFFLTNDLEEHIEDIWMMEIYPYLEEIFFDQSDRLMKYHWDKIKDSIIK